MRFLKVLANSRWCASAAHRSEHGTTLEMLKDERENTLEDYIYIGLGLVIININYFLFSISLWRVSNGDTILTQGCVMLDDYIIEYDKCLSNRCFHRLHISVKLLHCYS